MQPVTAVPLSAVPGLAWPALPPAPAQAMLAVQFQLERSQWYTPADLAAQQLEQLRTLVYHVLASVPHYRASTGAAFADVARDPSRLSWERFAAWPLLKKTELRERGAALLAARMPPAHGQVHWHATTGSTGVPVKVASSTLSQMFRSALTMRLQFWHELDFSLKYAQIIPEVEGRRSDATWGAAPAVAFPTGPAVSLNVAAPLDEQLDWLLAEEPRYLQGKGSNLRVLLLRSRETGRKPQGLRALLAYSENLPADLRTLARAIWDVPVIDGYSCGEAGMLAIQCPEHEHYHVQSELIVLEVLDEAGRPCAPGQTGRVVLTDLTNFAMPLIRYELGDYAQVGEPCPCGRGLPVLARLMGRTRNMATAPDGRVFWPSFPGGFWLDLAPIGQVQMVQHTPQEIEVRYVMGRELEEAERNAVTAALTARMHYAFDFRFTRVPAIARKPGEKFEDFICLCLPAGLA